MPIEQCHNIILLSRLRDRARALVAANRKAGNRGVVEIYVRIENWLEGQLAFAMTGGRSV